MKCCDIDSKSFFLFGSRIFFGAWLFYAGLNKLVFMGSSNFVGYIVAEFSKTWSPEFLNMSLAWLILLAEPLLGLLLLLGKNQRCVWTATTLLMFLLTFGQTMLQKDAGSNWMFTIFCLVCAAFSSNESSACCSSTSAEKSGCCSKS